VLFTDEEEAGPVPAEAARVAAPAATSASGRQSTTEPSPPPIFHPLAYREVVADWPVEWRERWGRRANALEESGLAWRDAETQAFVEVWKLLRQEQAAHSDQNGLVATVAERN
jgi:hypothetical protein